MNVGVVCSGLFWFYVVCCMDGVGFCMLCVVVCVIVLFVSRCHILCYGVCCLCVVLGCGVLLCVFIVRHLFRILN